MSSGPTRRDEFIARQAVFVQRQGVDGAALQSRFGAVFDARDVEVLRARMRPAPGSFREAFDRVAAGPGVSPEQLGLRGLALEQSIGEAYRGLWRGMVGFAHYALGLAVIATITFQVLLIFVVPQLSAVLSPNMPRFSHLVFEAGLGGVLLVALWLLVAWTFASVITARRAILLRSWPSLFARFGLLAGVVRRHRVLLHAWGADVLLQGGADPASALDRSRDALAAWTHGAGAAIDDGVDRSLLDRAAALGTLPEELRYRIANELADAPLALAARRERFALYAGLVAAFLVVPMLFAMYLMVFKIAAAV